MSDEQTPTNQTSENIAIPSGEWVMPEPVFRTSEGRTPGSSEPNFEGDEHDTESPNDEASDFAATLPDIKPELSEPLEEKAAQQKNAGGCFQSILVMFSVVSLSIAAIAIALIYFLFYWRTSDTTF